MLTRKIIFKIILTSYRKLLSLRCKSVSTNGGGEKTVRSLITTSLISGDSIVQPHELVSEFAKLIRNKRIVLVQGYPALRASIANAEFEAQSARGGFATAARAGLAMWQ